MCLFHLIKQDNRIRFSPHGFCQLAAFIVSDISWRRSDQPGHGVFLHVFTHIKTHHVGFIVKQAGSKCFCKFGLADTGRSQKQERTNWFGRIFDSCFGTDNRLCHFGNTIVLAYHTFVEFLIQVQCLVPLAFAQLRNRDSRPAGNNLCNLFIGDIFVYQRQITVFEFIFLNF